MATNKDSILVTNRDRPAQNKHRNKFVSKLVCALLNRRTHQGTEILTEDCVLFNRNTVCLRRLGNRGLLYLVVCIPGTRLNIWFFGIIVFRPPTAALTGRGRGFHVKGG